MKNSKSLTEKQRAWIAIDGSFKLLEKVLKNPELTDKMPRKLLLAVHGNRLVVKSASSKKKAVFIKKLIS